MFLIAHVVAGLIIGKITDNYPLALVSALLMDIDHMIPYVRHRLIFNPRKFWKTITETSDPYGNQRNYLHSIISWITISAFVLIKNPGISLVVSLGYLSHLFLDLIDGSDFYPFYPFRYKFIGPIKYLSKYELLFTLGLFVIFLIF